MNLKIQRIVVSRNDLHSRYVDTEYGGKSLSERSLSASKEVVKGPLESHTAQNGVSWDNVDRASRSQVELQVVYDSDIAVGTADEPRVINI